MKHVHRTWLASLLLAVVAFPSGAGADEVAHLIGQLRGRKAEITATKLSDLGKAAHGALLEALRSRHWKVRYWAAYALAYSPGAKEAGAIQALKPLLEDRKLRVRMRAAMALGRMGEKEGLEAARKYLRHRRGPVRAEAVAALAVSGDAGVTADLKAALDDGNAQVRYWALIGLRDRTDGEGGVSLGLKYLDDRADRVKMAAMEVLGVAGKGNPDVEKALIRQLRSRRWKLRRYAASVLARIGTTRSLGRLREVRDKDRDGDVRATADAAVVEIMKRKMKRP